MIAGVAIVAYLVIRTPPESDTKADHEDPNQSGCAKTAVSVPGISVAVLDPDGKPVGRLVLRRSTACETIWGRVEGLPPKPRPGDVMHVNVHRREREATANYHTPDVYKAVFGDMLSYRPGCVEAEAYLVRSGRRGPTAHTPCFTPKP